MSNSFCINMSGKSIPVYDRAGWPDLEGSKKIGTIYNQEAFGLNWDWGGDGVFNNIVFRNSSGNLSGGFIIVGEDFPNAVFTPCTDYPYGTAVINGVSYKTFKFRRSETVYTAAGNKWGAVASGMRVACRTDLAGSSHPEWKGINYVERSSDGKWIQVTGDGYQYGFVNTGLEDGSTPSTISMYGTW